MRSYRGPAGEPVVGCGVIGSSIAYHLAQAGDASDVVLVEPDPTYEFAATPRATGGILTGAIG
jgi:glycine/D-amino acid oxidase-like deaminating enzyme